MLQHGIILAVSFGYLSLLFAIAYYADKRADAGRSIISNPYVYTFSIAVYCTGWTFYGSVGRAASTGVGFLPVYLGPALAATVWWLVLRKIIRLSKANNITSIADFIASRYGKSSVIGGVVTVISIVGIMPYIALQLKAISASFTVLFNHYASGAGVPVASHDTALWVAVVLALFSILFGTRHVDVTERHEGMVAAIAFESIVKLLAFTAVGLFVCFTVFDGPADLFRRAGEAAETAHLLTMDALPGGYAAWLALTFISLTAILFLPRQFQILVVENVNEEHVRTASWLFPLYLLAINLFVLPIALGGLLFFQTGSMDADMFVLTLPLKAGEEALALFVFIGGLSAATGMVIVETIALSTMFCNDLLMPVLLRVGFLRQDDMGRLLLVMRRGGILLILLLGYLYFRLIGESYALVSIGLVSFAAAAQFAPPIVLGIYWKGASRRGALAGLAAGFAVWAYTLLLPSFARSGWVPRSLVEPGPFGVAALGPTHLFGLAAFDPITHAVFWSMVVNIGLLVGVSLFSRQEALEQLQAAVFVDVYKQRAREAGARLWHGKTRVRDLRGLMARMIGAERAKIAFRTYASRHGIVLLDDAEADESLVAFMERELAGTVGAASARVMVSSIIEGEALSIDGLMKILDETSQAIEYGHRLEQKSQELEAATAELKRTNERLKELDRMKDEFVSTVSHELRTPLTSIRAFSEILQDDPALEPQQRQQYLQIVVQETERLTRLVNQVLDFTKIESGAYEWSREKLELADVVQDALDATSQLSQNRSIAITGETLARPATVLGDKDRLVQVVINLLSNAIKYCEPGIGRVRLLLSCEGGTARLEVMDNGPGIEPGERERVFERFHQFRDPAKGKPQGTGLGLAICKTIIENHGGRIWVESNDWNGATFIFTLPVLDGQLPAPGQAGTI